MYQLKVRFGFKEHIVVTSRIRFMSLNYMITLMCANLGFCILTHSWLALLIIGVLAGSAPVIEKLSIFEDSDVALTNLVYFTERICKFAVMEAVLSYIIIH